MTEGDPISLTLAAEGGLPLTYTWECNGRVVKHQVAAHLSIPEAMMTHAGTYCCTVSNRWCGCILNAVVCIVLHMTVHINVCMVCSMCLLCLPHVVTHDDDRVPTQGFNSM